MLACLASVFFDVGVKPRLEVSYISIALVEVDFCNVELTAKDIIK